MAKKNRKTHIDSKKSISIKNGHIKIVTPRQPKLKEVTNVTDSKSRQQRIDPKVNNSQVLDKGTKSKNNKLIALVVSAVFVALICVLITIILLSGIKEPTGLKINDNILLWNEVEDAQYYIVDIDGKYYETKTNSLDISSFYPKQYIVKVQAVLGNNKKSEYSKEFKFEIPKQFIEIVACADVCVTKTYDGTNICNEQMILDRHYRIKGNLKYGSNVDITVLDSLYNNSDVLSSEEVEVRYSAILKGIHSQYYQVKQGSFRLNGKILPKNLYVSPNSLSKQFADSDNLFDEILDETINQKVSIAYVRQNGENIGTYDITDVVSLNTNFTVHLDENSGIDKFEIVPRIVNIIGNKDITLSKSYDGKIEFDLSQITENPYIIQNTISGYAVSINMLKAEFNSANVDEATKVIIYYDSTLVDSNGIYKTLKSNFEVTGKILPKTVYVIPEFFSKEFGDNDNLNQLYTDEDGTEVDITFNREHGESIGLYDIVSAKSASANFAFEIIENSGKNKFTINPKTLSIQATTTSVEKEYNADNLYNGQLNKNEHYVLIGELDEYAVDIDIISIYFNAATVNEANTVTVVIDEKLNDENNVYIIKDTEFNLPAKIHKKHVNVIAEEYSKQYGDDDYLGANYFDNQTDEKITYTYTRETGEDVGVYDIISAVSDNSNYEFDVLESSDKFSIVKRNISIGATETILTKEFDNTDDCNLEILCNQHYRFENIANDEIPSIDFEQRFDSNNVTASCIILSNVKLNDLTDRYELDNIIYNIPAKILPKQIIVEPTYYTTQYGEPDYMRQTYTDDILGFTFNISFLRDAGDEVGSYNITSATSDNMNYAVSVINGENKYQIAPRILGVEKVGNPVFTKVYDGTTKCILPITQGIHYNLTNLNGGTNVTLNIISKEYNSKNVSDATKIIVKYAAILDGASGDQFVTVGGTIEFDAKITPRAITVVPNEFHKDYLTDFIPRQSVVDSLTGDNIPVTFVSTAGENHTLTECGAYDIIKADTVDSNYTLSIENNSGNGKFIIDRIHLTINATDRNTVYNKLGQSINAPHSIPVRDLTVSYKLSTASDLTLTADLPVNAGIYTARIKFDGDHNYLPQYIERTLFIERAQSIITNTTPSDYIYDGTIKPLTATLNHNEAELQYSRNNYINAGTYNFILISVPQTQNYKATNIVVSFTIARCIMTNDDLKFPIASDITYGQYLSSSNLTDGSKLGRFSWVSPEIRPVVADTEFFVLFTPYDDVNYDWSAVTMQRLVNITVKKFVVSEILYPVASNVIYTNALETSKLTGTSQYGEFSWQNDSIVPEQSGYFNVVFTPYDENNYDFSSIDRIRAIYVEVAYRTYFETNGGSFIETMVVLTIDEAPFTYRDGYVFDGWYLDELCLQKVEFPLRINYDTILYANWYSEGLIFIKHDDHYSVKLDALTIERNIFIPSEYRGLPVTAIEDNGFKNCTALEVIVIPESIVSIGHYAFVGCVNLAFVEIINDIENINFGIDWIKTGYAYGSDVHFNAEHCPYCDGTLDFHQSNCENEGGIAY